VPFKGLLDNILAVFLHSSDDVLAETARRFKALRLALGWTQEGLANRSGVSLGSLKRFESSGLIAFDSLLRLAFALGCLDRFHNLAQNLTVQPVQSLDDLLARPPQRKRGRRK
jgi:transcriptional regulator with XRE-family HTH domain